MARPGIPVPVALTSSELRMWSTCRRRWLWQYGLRLSPVSTPRPLWWGSLMHAALAAWYRGMQVLGGQPSVALMRLILQIGRAHV